ncbi:MAG: DUF21 domain-containing protein [Candidatus Marinimicrobia bacterium]|nr:DUF21 domain-containing protein [Candidatus Neomarinimicrobiota bacterium]
MDLIIWIGIIFCLTQSAIFSGLNLAFFSVPRLRLEIEASNENRAAQTVLKMRRDSKFLLATILWGNVGINVLLTLLSNSVLAGSLAFLFSTFLITFFGEIIPQAYFSRHALKMAAALTPLLRVYQILLFVVAKPSAKLLDVWLGAESIQYFKEKSLKQLIRRHVEESHDIDDLEGLGAINFLSMDDLLVVEEGEPIHPESIISLVVINDKIQFPPIKRSIEDDFLQRLNRSKHKWVVVLNEAQEPCFVIDADGFLRAALLDDQAFDPTLFTHRPIVVTNSNIPLGTVIKKFHTLSDDVDDDVIHQDVVVLWGEKKQIITGADILGRLLRGIINGNEPVSKKLL